MNDFNINIFLNNLLKSKNRQGEFSHAPDKIDNIFLDFDDIVPFLIFFDQADEIKKQIDLSRPYLFRGFVPLKNTLYSYRMDEYLGGVIEYYKKTNDASVEDIITEQKKLLHSMLDLGYIPAYINTTRNAFSRTCFSRGYNLIEVILENEILSIDLKKKALRVLDNMLFKNRYFDNNKLFLNKYIYYFSNLWGYRLMLPRQLNFLGDSSTYFDINSNKGKIIKIIMGIIPLSNIQAMKDNSNLIYSVIEAYKVTGDTKYKKIVSLFIDGVIEKMYDARGFIHTTYSDTYTTNDVSLAQNFTFLDILMDYCRFIENDKEYIKLAKRMADFWIESKWDNHSIPENPFTNNFAFIDCQTDFSISLKKLSQLAGDDQYSKEGKLIFDAITNNFSLGGLLGSKINQYGVIIDTTINFKYNALFLKAYIAHNYNMDIFNSIFKDR
ncbi:MAG: hypothetical protein Q8L11_00470 [Candidatus Moranbacteria bacterium]|nr:hypothetical protein [Candidatus Moranbacteria bacterium]